MRLSVFVGCGFAWELGGGKGGVEKKGGRYSPPQLKGLGTISPALTLSAAQMEVCPVGTWEGVGRLRRRRRHSLRGTEAEAAR